MQLFSVEQNRSQALEAHTAAFSHLTLGGVSTNVIAFSTKTFTNGAINSKIHVIALGGAHKKQAELFFPDGFSDDFPVAMQIRCVPVTHVMVTHVMVGHVMVRHVMVGHFMEQCTRLI